MNLEIEYPHCDEGIEQKAKDLNKCYRKYIVNVVSKEMPDKKASKEVFEKCYKLLKKTFKLRSKNSLYSDPRAPSYMNVQVRYPDNLTTVNDFKYKHKANAFLLKNIIEFSDTRNKEKFIKSLSFEPIGDKTCDTQSMLNILETNLVTLGRALSYFVKRPLPMPLVNPELRNSVGR